MLARLSFLAGAGGIGASSALVQVADTSLLVDCGVRFRKGQALPDLD
jgi:predicted metal-dependent RNase